MPELDEYLPPGSSAIVAVVDDMYLDGVDKAVTKPTKKVERVSVPKRTSRNPLRKPDKGR